MLTCFTTQSANAIPITPLLADELNTWLENENAFCKNWLNTTKFTAKPESYCIIPDENGMVAKVLIGLRDKTDFWSFGALATQLPAGSYQITARIAELDLAQAALAWSLGAYEFTRYKKPKKTIAELILPVEMLTGVEHKARAIYFVRDLINTPAEDMGPAQLAQAAQTLANEFKADYQEIIGDALLTNNYPAIYTVGRAAQQPPCLIDLRWGATNAPKVTLVGKGVCFDTGGLDIKPASGMALMKKDMGGAAHVLGLAHMIMAAALPVRLRVLIPAVENAVDGHAFRPGDIITTRKGITVEVTNTDAEGRLVLCDALAEAVTENPDLLIDISTLTGAARIAVGTEISALFANNNALAEGLLQAAQSEQDPICRLPLYAPYRKLLDSSIADMANASNSSYAGAITAALYLKEFVGDQIPWAHFDIMAWNLASRPGRPEGAEAMGLRALFNYLQQTFR